LEKKAFQTGGKEAGDPELDSGSAAHLSIWISGAPPLLNSKFLCSAVLLFFCSLPTSTFYMPLFFCPSPSLELHYLFS